jgi:hypothetical protein
MTNPSGVTNVTKPRVSSGFPNLILIFLTASAGAAAAAASPPAGGARCDEGPAAAAAANRASLQTLVWSPSSRPETGWEIYAPLAAHEIATACPETSPAFAAALAAWQAAHRVGAGGVMDGATLRAMNQTWIARRPFVKLSARACPPAPDEPSLARATPAESYGGKTIELRPGALAAYRAMTAAARQDLPQVRADSRLMTLFSGYRSPAADAARCVAEANCQGVARASCSAHRTGLAMDIDLGAAPGDRIDSADDANRLFIARGAAYRWMVANAGRFGFVPYPFEPWHWEWTGEAP